MTAHPTTSEKSAAVSLPANLARDLDRVRSRHLTVKMAEFPVLLVAGLALAWLLQALADRFLDLSWATRCVLLSLDLAGALVLLWVFAIVPFRRRLNRHAAACLVESRLPEFRTSLISAVEFSTPGADYPAQSHALVQKLLVDVSAETSRANVVPRVIQTSRLKRHFLWMVLAAGVTVGCFFGFRPISDVLAQRLFLAKVSFPSRTVVVPVSADLTVAAGVDVPLSARAQGVVPSGGRVIITRADGRSETVSLPAPQGDVFTSVVKNAREPFRYRFELNDGVGETYQVKVIVPPSLQEVRFVQVYPAYTGLPETAMSRANLSLLEGGKLRIESTASEALQSATLEIKGDDKTLPLTISGAGKTELKTVLSIPREGWKSLAIHLQGASGQVSQNDPVYRVDLVTDRPPSITLTLPKKETITVLENAKVPVAFRLKDDFGFKRASITYTIFRPAINGVLQPEEEGKLPIIIAAGERDLKRTVDWDLSRIQPPVTTGCSLTFWVEAEDNNTISGPAVTRSAERSIVIVTEEEKRKELMDLLGERAKDLEHLYELQRKVNQKTDDSIR